MPEFECELDSFTPATIRVRARVVRDGNRLELVYALDDPHREVVGGPSPAHERRFERRDLLWQHTCFEAFWCAPGSKRYLELNLSPNSPAWNAYHFDDYRLPQPPRPASELTLVSTESGVREFKAILESTSWPEILEMSLCAIVRTAKETLYFSTYHAGAKPDFHKRENFTLRI